MKAYIRSPNYNPGLYCLLWTSLLQPVFNLMRWSFSMQPIKFTVTALILCGRGSNQSATQFKFWTDFSHGNEVACLSDQRSVSGALSNPVSTVYFILGILRTDLSSQGIWMVSLPGPVFCCCCCCFVLFCFVFFFLVCAFLKDYYFAGLS